MINILYLNPAGFIGGAEKSLLELLDNLPSERFRPLVALLSPGPMEEALRERSIDCRLLPISPALLELSRGKGKTPPGALLAAPFRLLPAAGRLGRLIRKERISIVHTNGLKAHLLGTLPARFNGRPVVWHFRDLPGRGGYGRLFRRLARILPSRIIANSAAVKRQLGNPTRARVVYNGVAIPPAPDESGTVRRREELGLEKGEIVIGTIGHLAPLKGYEDFLQAIPSILEKFPSSRFLITGDALYPAWRDYRRRLEALTEELGVAGAVIFTGGRADPGEILPALDIFVLPSRSEGFGRANLEAMAAGLPVVSTNVGGIPEVVIDGETGLLVPPNQPAALARAIITLAGDERRRRKFGAAGRKRAADFSIRRMTEGVIAIYDEILSGSRE